MTCDYCNADILTQETSDYVEGIFCSTECAHEVETLEGVLDDEDMYDINAKAAYYEDEYGDNPMTGTTKEDITQ